jgi:hypothetical protein
MMNIQIPRVALRRKSRSKALQTKHLPDEPMLLFLLNSRREGTDSCNAFPGFPDSIMGVYLPSISWKLVLSKAASMIRRGLISGCACGCRGQFRLTWKGLLQLRGRFPELFPYDYRFRGVQGTPLSHRRAGRVIQVSAGTTEEALVLAYVKAIRVGDIIDGVSESQRRDALDYFVDGFPSVAEVNKWPGWKTVGEWGWV